MLTVALALLAGLAALVDWWAVARDRPDVERWAKPATLGALVLTALSAGATDTNAGRWLLVGLACGLVGDVFLLGRSSGRFVAGLAAFLLGHLAYVVSFLALGVHGSAGWWLAGAVALLVALAAGRSILPTVWRDHGASLGLPVAAYTLVIGAMLVGGFGTARPVVAAGAAVFVVSDTVLALDRFVAPRPWGRLVTMVTYHVGQALLVLGVLQAARAG